MPTKSTPVRTKDSEWMYAAWEWAGELGSAGGPGVRLSMTPTTRAGVWKVVAAACEVVDGRVVAVVAKVEGEWPNSSKESLPAYLLNRLHTLDAVLAQEVLGATMSVDTPVD